VVISTGSCTGLGVWAIGCGVITDWTGFGIIGGITDGVVTGGVTVDITGGVTGDDIIKFSGSKKSSERLTPGPKPKSSGGTSLIGGINNGSGVRLAIDGSNTGIFISIILLFIFIISSFSLSTENLGGVLKSFIGKFIGKSCSKIFIGFLFINSWFVKFIIPKGLPIGFIMAKGFPVGFIILK